MSAVYEIAFPATLEHSHVCFRLEYRLCDAAASVEMNIAEGFRRYSAGEFTRFLRIARGSVQETLGWIQDGTDRDYFTDTDAAPIRALGDRTGRLITGLIVSLRPFTSSKPLGPPLRNKTATDDAEP